MNETKLIIRLNAEPAHNAFGDNAKLSFETLRKNVYANIHIGTNTPLTQQISTVRNIARRIRGQGTANVSLEGEFWNIELCFAFWQGFYDSKELGEITFGCLNKSDLKVLNHYIEINEWVRKIINQPANQLGPLELATATVDLISKVAKKAHVSYELIQGDALLDKSYTGIHTVGKGSSREPVYLRLDYNPTGDKDAPILCCLVGKGITFDSGGYSIKPSNFMESMKADMGGAALVSGSLALAILSGLKARVQLILCCADNMISGDAFKLGDVIEYRNGKTVEVLNTDAEGRLVLADGLIDASALKPQFIIDCATLTGAAKVALSNDYHALFSFDDKLANDLLASAATVNEAFWRLPLAQFHRQQFPSSFADFSNTNSPAHTAGASTAAAFLSYFVENYTENWLHIDCSATYRKGSVDGWASGATGIGVRTIANFILSKANSR